MNPQPPTRPLPPTRADFVHWHRQMLRWADNDAYGHVNNTVYYQLFDSAVNAWLVERGLLDIVAGDPIALVVSTACDYFAPLAFPAEVDVGLAVTEIGKTSVRYRLGVFAADETAPAAVGAFVHVAVSRVGRQPVPWPSHWRAAFNKIEGPVSR